MTLRSALLASAMFPLALSATRNAAHAQTPVFYPATGHYYVAVSAPGISWIAAKAAASSMVYQGVHGYLATLTDAPENQFVASYVAQPTTSGYWFGAYQDHASATYAEPSGGWTWVTGEPWSYTNWASPEPNNICCGGEDWAELYGSGYPDGGKWNDNYNSNSGLAGYLVEFAAPVVVYCTSGTSSNGCVPSISGTGTPSASSNSGFVVRVDFVEGQKQGILFYGVHDPSFTPLVWGNGGTSYMCVKSPTQRMNAQNSGGVLFQCNGALSADWNTFRAQHPDALGSPFIAGETLCAQGWFRDPLSPKTTLLSNAVRFVLQP